MRERISRKSISLTSQGLIHFQPLYPEQPQVLLAQPSGPDVDLLSWAENNARLVQERLLEHGAILFRNCGVQSIETFHKVFGSIGGELISYEERSSPRTEVADRVYTSTDYPQEHSIFFHNEQSYSDSFPLKLAFWCETPAQVGGETPLASNRAIGNRINPDVLSKFEELGWLYVRNYDGSFGLPWQTVFQTEDRRAVEQYCEEHDIHCEWRTGDRLKTSQVRPSTIRHPILGTKLWFNHIAFFHVSGIPAELGAGLLREYGEDNLPNNTYYGDGSRIAHETISHIRDCYESEGVSFRWQQNDLLVIDNLLTAHSRRPYAGERRILVAMAEPFVRNDGKSGSARMTA